MATDEDFEKLFDVSILESLEGALNDISLQMQSSSSDLKKTTEGDDISMESDYSSYHDDDGYTYGTNGTGFSYISDEEEDPETGEQDLYSMMDNLVAELESEMEFFVDKSDKPEERLSIPIHEQESIKKQSNPDLDSHSQPQTSSNEIAAIDRATPVGSSQDQIKNNSAKSLLKVLSVLAQSDGPKEKVHHTSDTGHVNDNTKMGNQYLAEAAIGDTENDRAHDVQKSVEGQSDVSRFSESTIKLGTENSGQAPYMPTEADFKHFVGVLADYSKRRRRGRAQGRSYSDAKKEETLREASLASIASQMDTPETASNHSRVLSNTNTEPGLPVNELPNSNREELVVAQGQREKTSRAIANFTLKKRREYMQRKRQSRNCGGVASAESTSVAVTTVKKESSDANIDPTAASSDTSSENLRRSTPTKMKKKKRRRTNKHRKGRPKRQTRSLQNLQATDDSIGAFSGSLRTARQHHTPNEESDNRTREEVIHALAKTELWRWLVTQVHEGKKDF